MAISKNVMQPANQSAEKLAKSRPVCADINMAKANNNTSENEMANQYS